MVKVLGAGANATAFEARVRAEGAAAITFALREVEITEFETINSFS